MKGFTLVHDLALCSSLGRKKYLVAAAAVNCEL
jgi:hypothetical protein